MNAKKSISFLALMLSISITVNLIGCKNEKKEAKECIAKCSNHISKKTESPSVYMWYSTRAGCYSLLNEYDKAIKDLKKAISLYETNSDYYYLSMVYLAKGMFKEAKWSIDNAIRIRSDHENYYSIRAYCFDYFSKKEKAIKDYTRFLTNHRINKQLKWEHYFSFVRRAILLMDKGQLGYALNDVNYALKIDQTGDDIYYLKFMIEAKAGQYDASYEDLKKSLKEGFNDREELENFVAAISNIDKTKVNEIVAKYIDDDLKNGFDFYNWDYIIKKSFNIIK